MNNALADFKKRFKIFVHKENHPIPFRISVHNVSSFDKAKCYLRHDDHYVEWFLKEEARNAIIILAKDIIRKDGAIFQGTSTFDLYLPFYHDNQVLKFDNYPLASFKEKVKNAFNDPGIKFDKKLPDDSKESFAKNLWDSIKKDLNVAAESNIVCIKILEKIYDLFPDKLRKIVAEACLGPDLVSILWKDILKKGTSYSKTMEEKQVSDVMGKINVKILETDTIKSAKPIINEYLNNGIYTKFLPIFDKNQKLHYFVKKDALTKCINSNLEKVSSEKLIEHFDGDLDDVSSKSIPYISSDKTMLQAREIMLATECKYILVTEHGKTNKKIEGWIDEQTILDQFD